MADAEIHGESVFAVEIVPQGIQVRTVFLTLQGEVLNHPAVFPNEVYALEQIDILRKVVIQKFGEAKKSLNKAASKNTAKKVKSSNKAPNVVELFKK